MAEQYLRGFSRVMCKVQVGDTGYGSVYGYATPAIDARNSKTTNANVSYCADKCQLNLVNYVAVALKTILHRRGAATIDPASVLRHDKHATLVWCLI